jgi:hypothetical protein
MKTYAVTIRAMVTKTLRVEAEDEDAAYQEAHELFNPYSGEAEERYEEETLRIEEVQS